MVFAVEATPSFVLLRHLWVMAFLRIDKEFRRDKESDEVE